MFKVWMQLCRLVVVGTLVTCAPKPVEAQRSDTIYQQIFTNLTATGRSSAVTNIGQSSHYVVVQLVNVTTNSCSSPNLQAQLEFSYDGSTYTAFGGPQAGTETPGGVGPISVVYIGSGAYPYVYFHVTNFDTTNCKINAFYSGTLVGSLSLSAGIIPIGTTIINSSSSGYAYNPVLIGGVGDGDTVVPNVMCNQQANAAVSGTSTLVLHTGTAAFSKTKGYVCSLVATTSASAATVQLTYAAGGSSGCSPGGTGFTPTFNITSTAPLVAGNGTSPIFTTGLVNGVTSLALCATATGGTVNLSITYAGLTDFGQ